MMDKLDVKIADQLAILLALKAILGLARIIVLYHLLRMHS